MLNQVWTGINYVECMDVPGAREERMAGLQLCDIANPICHQHPHDVDFWHIADGVPIYVEQAMLMQKLSSFLGDPSNWVLNERPEGGRIRASAVNEAKRLWDDLQERMKLESKWTKPQAREVPQIISKALAGTGGTELWHKFTSAMTSKEQTEYLKLALGVENTPVLAATQTPSTGPAQNINYNSSSSSNSGYA